MRRLPTLCTALPKTLFCLASALVIFCSLASADVGDPVDPLDPFSIFEKPLDFGDDEQKSVEELLFESTLLLDDDRPLDARTKLLKILQKDPKEYRAHLLLAGYYMVHVGHFNLALRYIKQGQNLFYEKQGPPPYFIETTRQQHQRILYLLSQARLSLDDYAGALDTLDEFTGYGYFAEWYPGSRAWILMKLGRLDEAVREARRGVFSGAEMGRTLNMLGILLSMTGDRSGSIEVFRQAISYEFSLGKLGQPATPLNNVGEVYEEIFNEALSQNSYSRALSLPDGCEHVLPSLNLAKLYLDELNYSTAKRTIDSFEGCVAQFPLRNGEEHRALVHLVRGRIALLSGHVPEAIGHFREVLAKRQWFGKIGTSQDDLRAAASVSLAQALLRRSDMLSVAPIEHTWDRVRFATESFENSVEAWWLMRRARQVLIEDLRNIEDLFIRNTDSMLEYPTFGEVLARLPSSALEARIQAEESRDARPVARNFYRLYRAEKAAFNGNEAEALSLLNHTLKTARPQFDDALALRAMVVKLTLLDSSSTEYVKLANSVFSLSRPALRNHGLQLPVRAAGLSDEVLGILERSPFLPHEAKAVQYVIQHSEKGEKHELSLIPVAGRSSESKSSTGFGGATGTGSSMEAALVDLSNKVFQLTLE